ncbi:MAG: hypothetical protein JWO28_2207 [Hyphomicrobiales bacterium]|nr:hypothetical protein [Hyphomicrobiales bacterium]
MNEFLVTSERQTKLRFHSRRYQRDGWLASYLVTLEGNDFSATTLVGNSEMGVSPARLFDEMVSEWTGWKGEKGWGALDGEMSMGATTDSLGHISLKVILDPKDGPPEWYARLTLVLESGHLEQLAAEARAFFSSCAVQK